MYNNYNDLVLGKNSQTTLFRMVQGKGAENNETKYSS